MDAKSALSKKGDERYTNNTCGRKGRQPTLLPKRSEQLQEQDSLEDITQAPVYGEIFH